MKRHVQQEPFVDTFKEEQAGKIFLYCAERSQPLRIMGSRIFMNKPL